MCEHRRIVRWLLLAMAYLALSFLTIQAQTSLPVTNTGPEAVITAKREDVLKLISLLGSADLIKGVLPKLLDQMKKTMPQVSEEIWKDLEKQIDSETLINLYVPIYEKHFSHEEVKEMLKFYHTPLGEAMRTKMPMVTLESMEVGNKFGFELGKQIEAKLAVQSTNSSPRTRESKTDQVPKNQARLSELERYEVVKAHGLDPETYDLDPSGCVFIPKRKPIAVAEAPQPVALPPEVRYVIRVLNPTGSSSHYFSKEEPKPFGSGFKFKMFPGDIETTVSGSVEIIKAPK